MSAYQFCEPGIGFPGVSNSGTVQLLDLGFIAGAKDPTYGYGEFMYVQGASASAPTAGDLCILSGNSAGQAVSGKTASQGVMGVAPAALSATNVYGWVQIAGICDYAKASNTSAAAGVPLFIATTAGLVHGTASATGFRVEGAWFSQYSATSNSNSVIISCFHPRFEGR